MKKVTITPKPSAFQPPSTADDWVQRKTGVQEPIKRLTIDMPASLHLRFKTHCVIHGITMMDVIRGFLEREILESPPPNPLTQPPASPMKPHPHRKP